MKTTLLLLSLALVAPLFGDVKLASPFTSHMVLQRDMKVPVWGTADAGAEVTVAFAGQRKSATAAADGEWCVMLDPLTTSADGRPLVASAHKGPADAGRATVDDVLVGEVWLASGQSNMAFPVSVKKARYAGLLNEDQEIAAAHYPLLRMFTAASTKTYEPKATVGGAWQVCSPETVPGWSAVGYLFGRNLQTKLNVPVGIVTVAYGASTAEAWLPRDAVAADPRLRPMLDQLDACVTFYREHPQEPASAAPPHPKTINARPGRPRGPQRDPIQDQHFATVLYNGMLYPVVPFAVRGVIWYQGESITGGTAGLELYGHVMKTLVRQWRALWGNGDLPFYFVQLPGQENISNNPIVREQQAEVLALPHTGMAVAIDTGEAKNVHPHNKEPVCDRLARLALQDVYGRPVEGHSPIFQSLTIDGSTARVTFSHAGAGLSAKGGGELKGFQIAGADHVFHPAQAHAEGDTVLVSSPDVPAPVAVRYAWFDYPEGVGCNLVSGDLPAAPFRTDHWPYPIPGIVE